MYIVGIIPVRYASSRFEGKPLADICGKPMIWWVYQQALKVKELNKLVVATDDERIKKVCEDFGMDVVMTSAQETPTARIHQVSTMVDADLYVCINGDEPLILPENISRIIPKENEYNPDYVANLIAKIDNYSDVLDDTNLKVVTNDLGEGVYISRSPVPYPKNGSKDCFKKHLGVVAYTQKMLNFYVNTPRSNVEKIEDIDLLRFIVNKKSVKFIEVESSSISVDVPKDIDLVRTIVTDKIKEGEIKL